MQALLGYILGMLAVVCAFGFIIFIHELGHFLTARAVDIRCPQFAIGFGPSLFSFRWRGTNFAVRAFPLGGYVLMNGEEPGDRTEDPWAATVRAYLSECSFPAKPEQLLKELDRVPEEERGQEWLEEREQVAFARCQEFPDLQSVEGNFHDRSVWARILVISGGVIMNFLAATILLWCLGPMVGVGSLFREWAPVVSQAVPGSPAAEQGVSAGSLLLSVDGEEVQTNAEAFHSIGAFPGTPFELKFREHGGSEKTVTIRPMLAVGFEAYRVDEKGALTLHRSPKKPEHAGKEVVSVKRSELVEQTRELVGKGKGATYQVRFAGEENPVEFQLPESFTGPRGQIGVAFGVMGVRFEDSWTGTIAQVQPDSPAAKAGLKPGDRLLMVGELPLFSNSGLLYGSLVEEGLSRMARVEQVPELEFMIQRGNEVEVLNLGPNRAGQSSESLGFELQPLGAKEIVKAPFVMIGQLLASPYVLLKSWLSAEHSGAEIVQNMQGPIGIMQLIYQLSDNGLFQFLYFVALLNAAIGAFNLLPFPALDGSRLVFLLIAAVRGKAVDPDKEARIHLAGLLVLLSFVVVVSFGDIKRLLSSQIFFM